MNSQQENMKLVYLESPHKSYYQSKAPWKWLRKLIKWFMDKLIVRHNIKYAKLCMKDCLSREEAPFASHLLYTQVLRDSIKGERKQGIEAGLSWGLHAEKTVVYCDYGITEGMKKGIEIARIRNKEIHYKFILLKNKDKELLIQDDDCYLLEKGKGVRFNLTFKDVNNILERLEDLNCGRKIKSKKIKVSPLKTVMRDDNKLIGY